MDCREVAPGVVFEYDREGRLAGIEVLGAAKRIQSREALRSAEWVPLPAAG